VQADPEIGTMIAVCEAARNITCSGGVPSAITNCLNFGNPYNPEAYWQFVGAIKGMSTACLKFATPVTGGNVSFYNQSKIGDKVVPVFPTPTIGMLGLVEDKKHQMGLAFKNTGDHIFILGNVFVDCINSSEYLYSYHGVKNTPAPNFDLDKEYLLHQLIKDLIRGGAIQSAHDVSDGGLICNLLESGFVHHKGFEINKTMDGRKDAFLFGEAQGRVVVSVALNQLNLFTEIVKKHTLFAESLGVVTNGEVKVDTENWGTITEFETKYNTSIEEKLN
jgi:phosphoribosylformylglycinamidine synthase